jgi:hypothetical protein
MIWPACRFDDRTGGRGNGKRGDGAGVGRKAELRDRDTRPRRWNATNCALLGGLQEGIKLAVSNTGGARYYRGNYT